MPLYEYVCPWCEERAEISHLMVHTPEVYCPVCVKVMNKGVSAPQITFNGTGFYSTDKTQA